MSTFKKKNTSKLIIGTANFNNKYGINNKKINLILLNKILNYSKNNQLNDLDCAEAYNSIDLLKDANLDFEYLNINHKLSFPKKNQHDFYSFFFEDLYKLNLQCYNIFFIHNIDAIKKSYKNIIQDILFLKNKKFIKKIGVSVYDFKEYKKYIQYIKPDIVQAPINILDQEFLNKDNLAILKENKTKIIARSVFLQGLLLSDKKPNNSKLIKLFTYKNNIYQNKPYNFTNLEFSLTPFLKNKNIYKIIVGIDDLHQLKDLINIEKNIDKYPNIKISNLKYDKRDKNILKPKNW